MADRQKGKIIIKYFIQLFACMFVRNFFFFKGGGGRGGMSDIYEQKIFQTIFNFFSFIIVMEMEINTYAYGVFK